MKKYAISFDLETSENDKRQDSYNKAEEYLQSFEYYVKPLDNLYLIATSESSSIEIRDYLESIFRKNDCILVLGLDGDRAGYNSIENNKMIRDLLSKWRF